MPGNSVSLSENNVTIMQISIIIIYKFVYAKQRSRAWQPFYTLNTAVWNSLINPLRHNDAICRHEI